MFGSKNRLNNSQAAVIALGKLKQIPWLKLNTAKAVETENTTETGNKAQPTTVKTAPAQKQSETKSE